jgi:TRAP-type C4-dicarboxylate transport system permease small subunit
MYTVLKKINKFTNRLSEFVVSISFGSMVILIFSQVIFRYILKQSLSWSEELATFIFTWLTFIGASVATKERSHINVEMIIHSIKSRKIKKIIAIFANVLSIIFLSTVSFYGFFMANQLLKLGKSSSSMPFLKIGLVYFAIPIGSLIMILHLIEIIIGIYRDEIQIEGGHS